MGLRSNNTMKKKTKDPDSTIKIDPLRAVTDRIAVLRVCFVFTLLAAAAACGAISYNMVGNLEETVAINAYESLVASALENAKAITKRKFKGSQVTASIMRYTFPNASMWPLSALNGYKYIANEIAEQSSTLTQAVNPIVREEDAEKFEQFAHQVFIEQGYPETAGYSDFGFGMFGINATGRYHRTVADTPWEGSKHRIFVPVFQHNKEDASSILFDVYHKEIQGRIIDSQLDCAEQAEASSVSPSCSSVSDFVELLIKPGPAALYYQPIYPVSDTYTQVAISASTLHWEEVLLNVVPRYIKGPIYAIISTDTAQFTYAIHSGVPQLLGPGDLHDTEYNEFLRRTTLTDFQISFASSKEYNLTFYPSKEIFSEFSTYSPLAVALGFAGVVCFSALVFFFYDYFVKHESHQRKTILEVKRRFVRFISHEIRTPLNTVCMGLELLKEDIQRQRGTNNLPMTGPGSDNSKLNEWNDLMQDITQNATDAVLVLNDLLNYDKIESGTLKLDLEEEDIYEISKSITSQLNIEAKHRGVALTFGYENNLKIDSDEEAMHGVDVEKAQKYPNVCVLADSSRLTQVIRNVISNALKFTKTGGCVEVTLILDSDTSEKQVKDSVKGKDGEEYGRVGTACVSVKDDGIGMTADQLGQLYGEGVQFDANKLQKGGGSGLGLWVSKGIVESHGGRICAESDGHEKGCIFTIHLPLVKSDHSMHHSYHHTSSSTVFDHSTNYAVFQGVPESAPEPRAYHMLVAEDSVPNRKMLVRLLERNGHTSDAAVDGEQAVEAVSATLVSSNNAQGELKPPFDVILMDYEMPNLNGPEATEQIRAIGYSGIVIGVTGNVLKEDVDFFKEKGANDVLSKPVRFADIQASLSKLKM